MTFSRSMINRTSYFMEDKGFRRKGKLFYRINNDIAFCVEFDYPGGLLYVTFYVIPLYVPSNGRYYTFGKRIDAYFLKFMPDVNADSSEEQLLYWTQSFEKAMKEYVLPYFRRICSPAALAEACRDRKCTQEYMNCPPIQKTRLLLHTYAYLQDRESYKAMEKVFREEIRNCTFLAPLILEKYQAEIDKLNQVICMSQNDFCAYQLNVVTETKKSCFG